MKKLLLSLPSFAREAGAISSILPASPSLSAVMILIVTFVGTWIHIYSTGYMAKDPGYHRYFGYLNLFTGAMLILVLGSTGQGAGTVADPIGLFMPGVIYDAVLGIFLGPLIVNAHDRQLVVERVDW